MRGFRYCLAVLSVAAAPLLAADLEPVATHLVRGLTLSVAEHNFAIDAPSADWKWLHSKGIGTGRRRVRAYVCQQRSTGHQFLLGVFDAYWDRLDELASEEIVQGTVHGFQKLGWTSEGIWREPSRLPLDGSSRFGFRVVDRDGRAVHVYAYAGTAGHMYVLHHLSLSATEPEDFRRFVASFRLLSAPPPDPLETLAKIHVMLYFAFLGAAGGIGWLINRFSARTRVNAWRIAFFAIVVFTLAHGIYWCRQMLLNLPAGKQGYFIGYVVAGPPLFPLLAAALLWRRLERKRAREGGST